jgi:hypothetical protein
LPCSRRAACFSCGPAATTSAAATTISERGAALRGAAFLATGLALTAPAQAAGAYDGTARALFGLAVTLAAAGVVAARRVPSRWVAAAAASLGLLGVWGAASPLWGGLPDVGWESLAHCATAAAALVVGNAAAREAGARNGLLAGLALGILAQAVESLLLVARGTAPDDWFLSRSYEGPIGYHNAQGAFLAMGLPLAVRFVASDSRAVRALGAASVPVLVAALLLTQSRGAIGVAVVALLLQIAVSRNLRTIVGVACALASVPLLFPQLRHVDAALTTGGPAAAAGAGARYLEIAAICALAAAIAAALVSRDRAVPAAVLAGAAALAVAATVAVAHDRVGDTADRLARGALADTDPSLAAPGATRLVTLSLDGRRDAWRVAMAAAGSEPITGTGSGTFARHWTVERKLDRLYILQPHSLELELLAELGVVAVVLFGCFLAAVGAALVRSDDRLTAAAGAGVVLAFVGEASVDWTWSFPVLLGTACAAAGAAAAPGRLAGRRPAAVAAIGVALLAVFLFGPRAVSAQALADARDLGAGASQRLDVARTLDPWSADAAAQSGRLAESRRAFREAARRYAEAASLSQRPWLQHFREARALASAGDRAGRAAACRRAFRENPGEPALHAGPCAGIR